VESLKREKESERILKRKFRKILNTLIIGNQGIMQGTAI
jgi:hypothetical protein